MSIKELIHKPTGDRISVEEIGGVVRIVYYPKAKNRKKKFYRYNGPESLRLVFDLWHTRWKAKEEKKIKKREKINTIKQDGHSYKVGQLLVSCWGWEQTNREFYQIVNVVGNKISIAEIETSKRGDPQHTIYHKTKKDCFVSDVVEIRANPTEYGWTLKHGAYLNIGDWEKEYSTTHYA